MDGIAKLGLGSEERKDSSKVVEIMVSGCGGGGGAEGTTETAFSETPVDRKETSIASHWLD